MRLKLHAGAHKTGTSTIQLAIRDVKGKLLDAGVKYITREELSDSGCLEAIHNLGTTSHEKSVSLISDFFTQFSNEKVVLISHESFFGYATHDYYSLKKRIPLYNDLPRICDELSKLNLFESIDIRYYIREKESFAQSLYFEYLQGGVHDISWEDYAREITPSAFDWGRVIGGLESAFGKESLDIVSFEVIKNGADYFLKDFFSWVSPCADVTGYKLRRDRPRFSSKAYEIALEVWPFLTVQQRRKLTPVFRRKLPIEEFGSPELTPLDGLK